MKRIFAILFVVVFLSGCEKEDNTYKGPALVDFPSSYSKFTILGNTNKDTVMKVRIRLVGKQSGNLINVSFAVDASSSAVSGTHYSIENTTVQIPANSSFGEIPIKCLIPSFPEQASARIVLNLTGGDLGLNENYKKATIDIYRQGFIDLFTGNYNCEEPDEPVSINYSCVLSADTTKNRIKISNFWNYAKTNTFVLIDLKSTVDSVYIPSQDFTDQSNRVYTLTGTGRYNITNGSMTLSYKLVQKSSAYTDEGVLYYTRK